MGKTEEDKQQKRIEVEEKGDDGTERCRLGW